MSEQIQTGPQGQKVVTFNAGSYLRHFLIEHGGKVRDVPIDIAAVAAGRDEWMRKLTVTCRECGKLHAVGEGDSAEYCQRCYDEAGEENARMDGAV